MKETFRKFFRKKSSILSISIILIIILIAILSPLFETSSYSYTNISLRNNFPNFSNWFGTDALGRDVWARVWFGIKVSLLISIVCSIISQLFGLIVGSISGYYGGIIDSIIMGVVDIGNCIPGLIYVTLIMIYLGSGITQIIFAISISSWMQSARVSRSRILQYKNQDFILYAKSQGAKPFRIIFKHILPNISGQIITDLISSIPSIIFIEAYLSFIGLGVSSPMVSLGQLCKSGLSTYRLYPYQFFIPAIILIILILCFYVISNNLRDALDKKVDLI